MYLVRSYLLRGNTYEGVSEYTIWHPFEVHKD
jgi:hypothetical protein